MNLLGDGPEPSLNKLRPLSCSTPGHLLIQLILILPRLKINFSIGVFMQFPQVIIPYILSLKQL